MNRIFTALFFILVLTLTPPQSFADIDYYWNGFGTFGLNVVDDMAAIGENTVPYGNNSEKLTDRSDSKLGIQANVSFNDRTQGTIQLVSRGTYDYNISAEWAYLSFDVTPDFTLRAGKLRRPLFNLSDQIDIGYSYLLVRPPSTTYFQLGPFYNSINSIDALLRISLADWDISNHIYIGVGSGTDIVLSEDVDYEEDIDYGGSITLENRGFTYDITYHRSEFSMQIPAMDALAQAIADLGFLELSKEFSLENKNSNYTSFSISKQFSHWNMRAEYVKAIADRTFLPYIGGWYMHASKVFGHLTLSYVYGKQWAEIKNDFDTSVRETADEYASSNNGNSGLTVSLLNNIANELRESMDPYTTNRQSHTLGIRYDIYSNTAVKLQYERLRNIDNDKISNIYSATVDFIF